MHKNNKPKKKVKIITDAVEIMDYEWGHRPGYHQRMEEEYSKLLLGQQIYNKRTAQKMSRKRLAEISGITENRIQKLELAEYKTFALEDVFKILAALKLSVDVGPFEQRVKTRV
jgi:DNA-binding Xre family transcriptional regulator